MGRLSQGHRQRGRVVHVRAALQPREHGPVDRLGVFGPARIMPPRGPRSVLWVVVVTTSAWGTGDGAPPAIKPAMWAMSAENRAPTSRAMEPMVSKSQMRG